MENGVLLTLLCSAVGTFALERGEVVRTGNDPTFAVTYPDDVGANAGGKYMGTLEGCIIAHYLVLAGKRAK